ncbi:hypothetical protein MNBD_GAMMA09-2832 [hydrothermal vent metagenome]|uniref:HIG1 domain-containing protein n=1 Tax=hydrothermal vent metagenome TaxID=652676 RepID=A0A3B0XXZ6_9ZZZZ
MTPIMFFIVIAFLGTFAMLIAGGVSMVRGGKFDLAHSNEFMRGRLLMHAITLGFVVIAIFAWS